jgi:hypothetical protein
MDAMAQEESLFYSIPIAVLNRMFFRTMSSEFLLESFASIRETHMIKKIREN